MGRRLDTPSDCDSKVYRRGEHIATITENVEPQEIEEVVKSAAKKSRQRIDWHYFGGRAIVKALGNLDKARDYLRRELEEHHYRFYRFTTESGSVIPWPIR